MNELQPTASPQPAPSTDLRDVLLTLAENLKVLIIGPLLLGIVVYGLAHLWPLEYESSAVLNTESAAATYMTTSTVLTASLNNLGLLKDLSDDEVEDALKDLRKNVTANAARNETFVTLKVIGKSPVEAQRMATEILANTFVISKPREGELKRLQAEKAVLELQATQLAATSKTAQRLLDEASPGTNVGALAESIATLSKNLVDIQDSLYTVEKKMLGLTSDDVVQAPTLARFPLSSKRGLLAVLTVLATGFVLVVFVLLKQAWRATPASAEQLERIELLKRKYRLG